MSNWFFMVGEPLAEAEQEQVQKYLLGLGIRDALSTKPSPIGPGRAT